MKSLKTLSNRWNATEARWAATWNIELFAITFSILCLAGLFAVLLVGDGQAIWIGITLNTYVASLATASKLSALFALSAAIGQAKWNVFRSKSKPGSLLDFQAIDLASRGPWGCLQLLYQRKHTVYTGALAFIVAFAFDPFAQQLVQVRNQISYLPSAEAIFTVTKRYNGGIRFGLGASLVPVSTESWNRGFDADADFSMQSAVLTGLVLPLQSIHQQSQATCPSGNCTWPVIRSLAVCSICKDITSGFRQTLVDQPTGPQLSRSGMVLHDNATRYSLGDHVYIDNIDGYTVENANFLHLTAFSSEDPRTSITMQEVDTLMISTTFLSVLPDAENPNATWPNLPLVAAECVLYYCVRSYNVSMRDNIVHEVSSENADMHRSPDSWQWTGPGKIPAENATGNTMEWGLDVGMGHRTDLMIGDGYNVTQTALAGIGKLLQTTFIRAEATTKIENKASNLTAYYMVMSGNPEYAPDAMQPIYEQKNFTATFEAIAASMSNAMRAHQNGSLSVTGEVGIPNTKYRVEWPWIILPIVVVLASLIQLVMTIYESRHHPLWKSDVLAVLSRGRHIGDMFAHAEPIADMRQAASHERVSLLNDIGEAREEHRKSSGGSSMSTLTTICPDEAVSPLQEVPLER
ncbi:hypothetical protein HII31_12017 [Pseudocercospora fuligena]|uniref:Uncharacterized protein n=1 Tax=Pseudocercospora fuligena TaxID=685502 RepID=A0A8H6R8S9_9PEZI|nr:hypothetical protein HII31_12017 [Pseudocercospora fuligena]